MGDTLKSNIVTGGLVLMKKNMSIMMRQSSMKDKWPSCIYQNISYSPFK